MLYTYYAYAYAYFVISLLFSSVHKSTTQIYFYFVKVASKFNKRST